MDAKDFTSIEDEDYRTKLPISPAARHNNNNNNTINCLPSQQQLLPPARSSLKIPHNNSVTLSHAATHPACDPMTPASPLSRCCSLESPKKLRFATQSNYYQGIPSDSEVFPCTEPLCNGDHNQSCNCPVSEDLEEEDTGLVLKFNNNNNNNHSNNNHLRGIDRLEHTGLLDPGSQILDSVEHRGLLAPDSQIQNNNHLRGIDRLENTGLLAPGNQILERVDFRGDQVLHGVEVSNKFNHVRDLGADQDWNGAGISNKNTVRDLGGDQVLQGVEVSNKNNHVRDLGGQVPDLVDQRGCQILDRLGQVLDRVDEHEDCTSISCPCVCSDNSNLELSKVPVPRGKYFGGALNRRGGTLSAPNTPLMVTHSETDVSRVPLLAETPM
uniref:Uncharacterized protein n=1 Tax=Cacopsylla melanoneura TaxID=428564 RepID=A0A8D8LM00_9HEMI